MTWEMAGDEGHGDQAQEREEEGLSAGEGDVAANPHGVARENERPEGDRPEPRGADRRGGDERRVHRECAGDREQGDELGAHLWAATSQREGPAPAEREGRERGGGVEKGDAPLARADEEPRAERQR
jgi:hypothetical protein